VLAGSDLVQAPRGQVNKAAGTGESAGARRAKSVAAAAAGPSSRASVPNLRQQQQRQADSGKNLGPISSATRKVWPILRRVQSEVTELN